MERRGEHLLGLDYNPSLPRRLLVALERKGRRLGVDLDTMELLGQEESVLRAFLEEDLDAGEFLRHLDREALATARSLRGGGITIVERRVLA